MRLLLPLLLPLFLHSQQPHFFRHFTQQDGLSSNDVTCLLRARDGFLWIGTNYGLNRYDGRSFRHYLPDTRAPEGALSNEYINALAQDSAGYLWIATRNGLDRYDPRTATIQAWREPGPAGNVLPNVLVTSLLADRSRLWLACDNRDLAYLDLATGLYHTLPWKKFAAAAAPQHAAQNYKTIHRLTEKTPGVLWLETNLGLFSFDKKTGQFRFHSSDTAPEQLVQPTQAPREFIFFEVYNKARPVQAFSQESDGTVWFGSEQGLWQLDPRLQHFHELRLDATPAANSETRYGRALDAPALRRRFVIDRRRDQLLVLQNGRPLRRLPLGGPAELLQYARDGRIWVSGGAQVFKLDPQTLALTRLAPDETLLMPGPKTTIVGLAEDAAGDLWLATSDRGLLAWQHRENRWYKPGKNDGFLAENLSCIFADTARRTLWIGSLDYGLFRLDEAPRHFKLYRHEESNPQHSLGAYMVQAVCRDRLGYIWVATDPGGLSRFDYAAPAGQEFTNLDTRAGLPSNQVCALLTDGGGNIWAGTTKGLAWVDARTLQLRVWGQHSGLYHLSIDQPLSAGADGSVLIGGTRGYEFFYPDSLLAESLDPRILLTSFKVFDREIIGTFDSSVVLDWRDNFFSVEFSSANFSRPETNEFMVRLHDFDADWKACGARGYAAWTNVPPGHYVLEIRAIHNGQPAGPGRRWNLRIVPPYWQTWWFRLLAFSTVVALGIVGYQYRIGQIRRAERLNTEFNRRLARVEMSALRAQMNPHFVFNCLNSINRFILVNEPAAASGYLTRFSRLIRLILDNSRSETVLLEKELEALRLYLEMESMRFDGRFEFGISVDSRLEPAHLEVPPLLIQPFVENAVWHGLMHRKTPGILRVRVFPGPDGALQIEIEDNGVGRARARELRSKSAQTHKSQGMQVTSERLDLIRSLYGVDASVRIDDLFTPEGAPAGTRVNLRIA